MSRSTIMCWLLLALAWPYTARADKLRITTTPPGAIVEIDGVKVGTTPFEKSYPGGFFHKVKTAIGSRLEHPLVIRLTLDGYATKEMTITDGPQEWVSVNGRTRFQYFLLKSDHFEVKLDSIPETFTGSIHAKSASSETVTDDESAGIDPILGLEDLVKRTKPAVVFLKGVDPSGVEVSGTGFFVTSTGVIATNAHVARGHASLLAVLPDGTQLNANVVHVDQELDIALLKVPDHNYPSLPLKESDAVHEGQNVVAIGNPSDAMLFSVTRGIVSQVGHFPSAGPGIWIQTDAPINPGNSGGPLVDLYGAVVGINTQKLVKKNVNGIGFALSATDLLQVLRRYYPKDAPAAIQLSGAARSDDAVEQMQPAESLKPDAVATQGFATVYVDGPDEAEVLVDRALIGNAKSKFQVPAGQHLFVVRAPNHADWMRLVTVLAGSEIHLKPTF